MWSVRCKDSQSSFMEYKKGNFKKEERRLANEEASERARAKIL